MVDRIWGENSYWWTISGWISEVRRIFIFSYEVLQRLAYNHTFTSAIVLVIIIFLYLMRLVSGDAGSLPEFVQYTGKYFTGIITSFFIFTFSFSFFRYEILLTLFIKYFTDKKVMAEIAVENIEFDKTMPDIDWKDKREPLQYRIDVGIVGFVKQMYQRGRKTSFWLYIAALFLGVVVVYQFIVVYSAATIAGALFAKANYKEYHQAVLQLITNAGFAMYRWHKNRPRAFKKYIFSDSGDFMKEMRFMYKYTIDQSIDDRGDMKVLWDMIKKKFRP